MDWEINIDSGRRKKQKEKKYILWIQKPKTETDQIDGKTCQAHVKHPIDQHESGLAQLVA